LLIVLATYFNKGGKILKVFGDNHFKHSDENMSSRRITHVVDAVKESLNINVEGDNKFTPSDEQMSSNKVNHILEKPINPIKHPIVNLCMPYIESVFFQLDSAPGTSGTIQYVNHEQGRIIKFIYYLDSSMSDNVKINVDIISRNTGRKSLLKWVDGGNSFIKGTNNSTILEFQCNMQIFNGEQIQITYANTSTQDCTIMAMADMKFGEEDFV
jgi:hypothetical protein